MSITVSSYNALSQESHSLRGQIQIPGDKSISHRAIILGSLAQGKTEIHDLLEAEDVLNTITVMNVLGANLQKEGERWVIYGVGNGCLLPPSKPLYFGNSGTSARLIMGLLGSYPFESTFMGDDSLSKRPMQRILEPLQQMGVQILTQQGNGLPLTLRGATIANPICYESPVPSAQVKSAILLAALNTPGITTFIESTPTRDHSEIMLQNFGVDLNIFHDQNKKFIRLEGQQPLIGQTISVPSDPSSAAFFIVAALITPNSDITLPNILMNETRIGLIQTLLEMGANIQFLNKRTSAGEKIADLRVRSSPLKAVNVPKERAASMIDEYPILAVASAFAEGTTKMYGIGELRVKESDRLKTMALGLQKNAVPCEEGEDFLFIRGENKLYQGNTIINSCHDHRIAMSFLVFGLRTKMPILVEGAQTIATSFPNFVSLMQESGAKITTQNF